MRCFPDRDAPLPAVRVIRKFPPVPVKTTGNIAPVRQRNNRGPTTRGGVFVGGKSTRPRYLSVAPLSLRASLPLPIDRKPLSPEETPLRGDYILRDTV